MQTLVLAYRKHVKLKINIEFDIDFRPISNDFDSQGMAASRAAHYPHILRASRQVTAALTAAARQNAVCRRVFCALQLCILQTAHTRANTVQWFREVSFSRLECGVHDKLQISSADWWDLLLPLA